MNRQTPGAPRATQLPSSYRTSQPPTPNNLHTSAASMYYATAGAQTTSQPQAPLPSSRALGGGSGGGLPAGYPSVGAPRGGPPGFASRPTGDQGDFPALGSHATSSYASQAQPGQYMSQQSLGSGLQPPGPPPGISAPGSTGPASGGQSQTNGSREEGDDFPALGGGQRGGPGSVISDGKDRLSSYLRNPGQHSQAPMSPPTIPNGASGSHSHSNSATPSANNQHQPPPPHLQHASSMGGRPQSTADPTWIRDTPSRGIEQITRPAQQILTSPVDQWGLQALLFEIKMGKSMLFGEDLGELGIDMNSDEPLYPTFVTPWLDPSQRSQPLNIEEQYSIPQCYLVTAPPMSSKLNNFSEDTLFYIFYTQPQDVAQLEVADELYNRGWRYHIPHQTWMSSPLFANFDPRENPPTNDMPYLQGPIITFNVDLFKRTQQTMQLSPVDFEQTRPAHVIVAEDNARKESMKSPNGSVGGQPIPVR